MAKPRSRQNRSDFGRRRRLPSGRYQAGYDGPDAKPYLAPTTFATMLDADAWLATQRRLIDIGEWTRPTGKEKPKARDTLAVYGPLWIVNRRTKKNGPLTPLTPMTQKLYRSQLSRHILPMLGDFPMRDISETLIEEWYAELPDETPTAKAHAYALLSTIMSTAEQKRLIVRNPCRIWGGGAVGLPRRVEPATLEQIAVIKARLPERYRMMVEMAVWLAIRWGELTELRRSDFDFTTGRVRIHRAVTWPDAVAVVGKPKTEAGVRDLAIPPHLIPLIKAYLLTVFCEFGRDGLLFPAKEGGHLRPTTFWKTWDRARLVGGRPDLRWHDLRHTGCTWAFEANGTIPEVMEMMGHSTPNMAIHYAHVTNKGKDELAQRISDRWAAAQK